MQVPVVASRVGGLRETVRDGVTGCLVTPGDPMELAQAIIDLLKNPRLRTGMGDAGRRMVIRDFAWSKTMAGLAEAYSRACAHPASA